MQQFKTLLEREWLQQHRSWLAISLYIPLLGWGLGYLYLLNIGLPPSYTQAAQPLLAWVNMGIAGQLSLITFAALMGVIITVPGLPYRDQDDKSLAFWRSLPIRDVHAVAAPILMNAVLLPLLAITLAFAMSMLLAAPLWLYDFQIDTLLHLGGLFSRVIYGSMLGLLCLLPLVLLLTLGNSLLRRWGILLMLLALYLLNNLMLNLLGYSPIAEQISFSFNAIRELMWSSSMPLFNRGIEIKGLMMYPFTLNFLQNLIWTAALFAVLVWQRHRGASA